MHEGSVLGGIESNCTCSTWKNRPKCLCGLLMPVEDVLRKKTKVNKTKARKEEHTGCQGHVVGWGVGS